MKLKRQIIITSILILVLGFSGFTEIKAVLGPVHVELNITGERLGASRANTVTAFKIYMKINKNIEVYDWIKIWFPIDETSCNPEDICGEPLVIKGYKENPRFVPNEKYFEKYDNPEEKEIGKLYKVHEPYEMETTFYDCKSCNDPVGKCRIIEDPSGLGCWIMGTVLPALPKNQEDRIIRAHQIEHTTSIGYSPCGDCGQGGIVFVQTENERTLKVLSPVGIEAWRQGYNPMNYNTSKATGIIAPATPGRYRIRIATEAEPTPVESESFVLPCSKITKPEFIFQQFTPDDDGDYILKFNVGEGGALDAGNSLINIKLPDCINVQSWTSTKNGLSVNGSPRKARPDNILIEPENNTMTFVSPCNVDNMDEVTIRIKNKVLENNCDDPFSVFVSTSSEPEMVESTLLSKVEIPESAIFITDIKLSDNRATMPSSYSFTLKPSPICKISSGDNITIEFPKGTILPEKIEYNSIKAGIGFIRCSTIESNKLVLQNMNSCEYPSELKIEILKSAEIINTRKIESYQLKVTAPCSEEVSLSEFFAIAPAPLITTLTFKDPGEPDGCNGWYQTSPILSLVCRNPEAKIYLWYDRDTDDKHILYGGEKRLSPGSMRPIIHYQAIYGDEKEEPKSVQLFLDTIPPAIEIVSPSESRFVTRDDIFIMKGERYFIEMLTDEQASHQVADGVLIKVNDGELVEIFKPEIFHLKERDNIESEWEYEVELEEGENIITVLGRDQACNEDARVYTIIRDNTAPEVKIISLYDGSVVKLNNIFTFKIETESDARVFINDYIASVIEETENGNAIFAVDLEMIDFEMTIEVKIIDVAGNISITTMRICASKPQHLKLWINSRRFEINNRLAKNLYPVPTNQSPPLPAKLAGNTYMPVRAVFEALGASVNWDGNERRVEVWLDGSFLQLWIDNPKAKTNGEEVLKIGADGSILNGKEVQILGADGKTVLYPTIVAGRTMLPLRFACETLGAEVGWNAQEKAVTISYPGY